MYYKEKSNIRMHSLIETSKILNSKQDTDTILDTLLSTCLELVPGGNAGAIFLYNNAIGLLEMKAFSGMGKQVAGVKLSPGESMTGITFNEKKPIFFKNNTSVTMAMNTMNKSNTDMAVLGNIIPSNIYSSICCPLMHKELAIGVLVIDNLDNTKPLVEDDVGFLEAISIQATIAIINAQNYEKEIAVNNILKESNRLIEKERNDYRFSIDTHNKFTDMVLNGSSVDDIILETKKILGSDVFIIDLIYNIPHDTFDDSILLDRIKNEFTSLIAYLKSKERVTCRIVELKTLVHIFPIIVNRESMGWLCIMSEENILTETKIITIEKASTILALEMLKLNELYNMEQALKGDFIESLILNNSPDYIRKCCNKYNLKTNSNFITIVFQFDLANKSKIKPNNYDFEIKKSINNYYQIINENMKTIFPNCIALVKANQVVVIIENNCKDSRLAIESFLANFEMKNNQMQYYSFLRCNYKVGISDSYHRIEKFSESFNNAMYSLKMVPEYGKDKKYLFYDELEIIKFIMNNDKTELSIFINKILGPLIAYGGPSNDSLIKTLRTYLKSNCSWTYTKDELHIHGNTLTYRLNKINEILNIDLNNYNDKLKLQIAFEIFDII